MKVVYICHPISGDVIANLRQIKRIARKINLEEPETVPFAPYFLDCYALDDSNPQERKRGIKNDIELLKRGFIDELRLYGERISFGMEKEIEIAKQMGIPVVACSEGTKK